MDPKHLVFLAEIIDLGSMSRASQRLNVTQPTLSRIVRVIEDRVGSPVLRRGRYGVTPTAIGERLADEGREISRRATVADEAIDHWKLGLTGEVRVGVGPMLAATVMGDFFADALRQGWPYSVQVFSEYAARLIDGLNNDNLDAAVLPSKLNLHQERLSQAHLFDDQLVVFASASGRFAGRAEPVDRDDLDGVPWVETAAMSGLFGSTSDLLKQIGLDRAAPKLRFSGDIIMALQVVAATDALCILPERLVAQLPLRQRVVPVPVAFALPRRDISFWTGTAKRDRPEIRHLKGKLDAHFARIGLA